MSHKVFMTVILLIAVAVMTVSCEEDEASPGKRSPDWTEETHGNTGTPDYDLVFGDEDGVDETDEDFSVKRIDITITPSNWKKLSADMVDLYGKFGKDAESENPSSPSTSEELMAQGVAEQPEWQSCTVEFNGLSWSLVGIRIKGSQPTDLVWRKGIYKLPFELDFDVNAEKWPAIENQRFYGFDSLLLANNYLDNSLIREKIAGDLFREFGVPAPATTFCRLYIDIGEGKQYFGLYTLIEGIGDSFLENNFGNSDGNIYAPNAKFSEGFDSSLYFRKNNQDDEDFSDVEALYDAINYSSGFTDLWKLNLESVFDVDGFLRWIAADYVMQNWNSYGVMENNFTLYHDTGSGVFHWIPSAGNNSAISPGGTSLNAETLGLDGVDDSWPFIRFIMDQYSYRQKYILYIDEMIDDYYETAKMDALFQAAHDLIAPYVTGDDGEVEGYTFIDSDSDFEDSVSILNDYVSSRYDVVKELVFTETSK